MGAVHGVYLKYVFLSGASYVKYSRSMNFYGLDLITLLSGLYEPKYLANNSSLSRRELGMTLFWGYSTIINGAVAALFKMQQGMRLIGKNRKNGSIPLWSYILFFPFHAPTW